MEFVTVERDREIAVLSMGRGKANAFNQQITDELVEAFTEAANDVGVRAVVLASSRPRFFSAGLDAGEVFQYDRARMGEFFAKFIDLYEMMFHFPKPLVGAVSGHAYAGGAVLSLACHERVLASGEFGFALNEINLGIVVAPGMIRMARLAAGEKNAYRMVCGETITPAAALEMGLAAEVVAPESVVTAATERARALAAKPPQAYKAVRQLFLETTGDGPSDQKWLDRFLDHWFSDEALTLRAALTASLKR